MREDVIATLNELNRTFYDTFAGAFSDSRGSTEPGLERILQDVAPGSSVLDLGCGQGRIALLLPEGCTYTGMDFSPEMLAQAQQRADEASVEARFILGDLIAPPWPLDPGAPYDWIILRAVLHHIPSYAARLHILQEAAEHLAAGGHLVIANWQFLSVERLRRRIQDWAEIGLREEDIDPGDYLLDWRREGRGFRYVHLVDAGETARLASDAGLRVEDSFLADGHENNLTLYALLGAD